MPPTRVIYASDRTDQSPAALDAVFEVSQANNSRDDITGALIVGDRFFLQVLEGDRRLVSECMGRVMRDVRHKDVELIAVNLVPHRLFADWSLHRIDAAAIGKTLLKPFLTNGTLQPKQMGQHAIEGLCRMLSSAASETSPQESRILQWESRTSPRLEQRPSGEVFCLGGIKKAASCA